MDIFFFVGIGEARGRIGRVYIRRVGTFIVLGFARGETRGRIRRNRVFKKKLECLLFWAKPEARSGVRRSRVLPVYLRNRVIFFLWDPRAELWNVYVFGFAGVGSGEAAAHIRKVYIFCSCLGQNLTHLDVIDIGLWRRRDSEQSMYIQKNCWNVYCSGLRPRRDPGLDQAKPRIFEKWLECLLFWAKPGA